jgi:hypothetical protein
MKNIISFAVLTLIFCTVWFSSCTKEIIKVVDVTDTIKINTHTITHDTTKYIVGMDSVKVDFTYIISYQSDSMSYASIRASDNSKNVPLNAVYTWRLDNNSTVITNLTYYTIAFLYSQNGPHILSLSIYCPDIKRTFTTSKTFITKLKG